MSLIFTTILLNITSLRKSLMNVIIMTEKRHIETGKKFHPEKI